MCFRPTLGIIEVGPSHAFFDLQGLPRCDIVCHWHRCGAPIGPHLVTLRHRALGLLSQSEAEKVSDFLVDSFLARSILLGEFVKKHHGGRKILACSRETRWPTPIKARRRQVFIIVVCLYPTTWHDRLVLLCGHPCLPASLSWGDGYSTKGSGPVVILEEVC